MRKKSQDIRNTFKKKYLFGEFQLYVDGENRVLDKANRPYSLRHKYLAKALRLTEFFFDDDLLRQAFSASKGWARKTENSKDGIAADDLKTIFGSSANHVVTDFRSIFGKDSIPLRKGFYHWSKAKDFRLEYNPKDGLLKELSDYNLADFIENNLGYASQLIQLIRKDGIDEKVEKSDAWKDREFFVAAARISLSRVDDGNENKIISAKVFLPKNPYVAFENKSGNRNRMERFPNEKGALHPLANEFESFNRGEKDDILPFLARFSAGGSLTVLRVPTEESFQLAGEDESRYDYREYIFVSQKDIGANIHRYHLVPSSGIAECEEDFTNPLLVAASECAEEIHLRDRESDRVWYRPQFKPESFARDENKEYLRYLYDLNIRINETVEKRRKYFLSYLRSIDQKTKRPNLPYSGRKDPTNDYENMIGTPKNIDAELYRLGHDTLTINGVAHDFKGLLVIDEKYGALDLMTTVVLTVNRPLSKLLIYDGESHDKKLLWRNSFIFEPGELQKIFNGNKGEDKSRALFFGSMREDSEWLNGVIVRILSEEVDINPPLLVSGKALLKKRYDLDVTTPYEQQNKQRPFEMEIISTDIKSYEN